MTHPTTIQTVTLPENTRILITSDIHGHCTYLKRLLEEAAYTPKDILIINGDILERGTENLAALRFVMELSKSPNFYMTTGNVDTHRAYLLRQGESEEILSIITIFRKNHGTCVYLEMFEELGLPCGTVEEIEAARPKICAHFKRELDFLLSFPTILDTQSFTVVHGGMPIPNLEECGQLDGFALMKNDAFLSKGIVFPKYVFVGHWPVVLYGNKIAQYNPIVRESQKIIALDGGCGVKTEGQLNLFIIPEVHSTDFSFLAYDDFPMVTALESQTPSKDSVNLTWPDLQIDILEQKDSHVTVRHRSTGKILTVPPSFLWQQGEEVCLMDYTDYCLPISSGDKLKLLQKTALGYYVKKDCVVGWYTGQIQEA